MAHPLSIATWNPFTGADSYEVQVKTGGGSVVVGPTAAPTNSIAMGPLMVGQAAGNYQLEVRAVVSGYVTAWSAPLSFTWSLEVPGVVTGLAIS